MIANDVPSVKQEGVDKTESGKEKDENLVSQGKNAPNSLTAGDTCLNEKEAKDVVENLACDSLLSSGNLPPTLQERFLQIKQTVKDAIASHRTFMVYGRSRVVRDCMLKRGWCEKYYRKPSSADQYLNVESNPMALLAGIGDLRDEQSERQLISRMLSNHVVDFLWNTGSDWPGWPSQDNKTTVFNRFCRAGFTSKVGLCSNVRQMHWYYEAGVANTLFPRCYNVCQGDQLHAFIDDFRFTACLGLLKWLVDKMNTEGENAARSPNGTVPLKALDFAIRRCSDYIGAQSHDDIDQDLERVWSHQWDQFICWYYKIVQGQAVFVRNNVPFDKYCLASRHILKRVRKYWPQLDMDGIMNLWILKPGNKSRGRGIMLVNKLDDVVAKVNPANKTDTRYVVQKYIERPFLVYGTKFDIRQWFIITCAQPLTLWMYRESYLRFCSQQFRLTDFHESIHLCNHAIQCKYKNSNDRDPALPSDNMWDATTFKQFLKEQGHTDVWDEMIYPGMKQSLVGSLLASQEAMDRRKNSFELYGADFMVMDDFSVWLIEINSHPDMSYTSSVTARLCRQVQEDTIRVVLDFREDKNADTGEFELAYRQRMPTCQPYLGAALSLQGTRIASSEKKANHTSQDSKWSLVSKSPSTCVTKAKTSVHNYIGPVIVDLIEELEIQLDQEFYAYYSLNSGNLRELTDVVPELLKPSKMSFAAANTELANDKNSPMTTSPLRSKAKSETPSQMTTIDTQSAAKSLVEKSPGRHKTTPPRAESTSRRTVISKIMEIRKPPNVIGSAELDRITQRKQNYEKVNGASARNTNKYKKNGTTSADSSTFHGNKERVKINCGPSTARNRNRSTHRKQNHSLKKSKVLTDITDMYAIGHGLTK